MSCCTIFKIHDVHSFCFVNTDLRSLTIICIIYTCYKCLACESKMASILNLIVGSSVGCPLNCPLFPYLKVVGYQLSCPLSCPLYPYKAVVGSLICMAKFPWAAHGQPTPLPTELPSFSCFEVVGCPLSCPLFPYMEVEDSLNCMAKFSWAAHGQPTPLPTCSHWAAKWAAPLLFLSFYPNLVKIFQEYIYEGISYSVFYGDLVYKLRRVKGAAILGSKIVQRLCRLKYNPVIIERTIC